MNQPTYSPPAKLDTKTIDELFFVSREKAFERAAETEENVSKVKDLQREELLNLMYGKAKGSDGIQMPQMQTFQEQKIDPVLDQKIEDDHAKRMAAIQPTPDAYVLKEDEKGQGTVILGVQNDGDRSVGLSVVALDDTSTPLHERQHTLQATGNQVAHIPETGVKEIDQHDGNVERIHFREADSMEADGKGKENRPKPYQIHQQTNDASEKFLTEVGLDGQGIVKDAAMTVEGFRAYEEGMLIATVRHKVKALRQTEAPQTLAG